MRPPAGLLLLFALGFGAGAGALRAQQESSATILGSVTDSRSGAPLSGVFVVLLDEADLRLNAVLTDEAGRFVLRTPAGSPVRIRAERIGLETVRSQLFVPVVDQVITRDLTTAPSAVTLAGVEVTTSSRRCSLREADGTVTVRLWEEARKALEVAQWTDDTGYRYDLRSFERILDDGGRVVEERRSRPERRVGFSPFTTLAPDSLVTFGFIQRDALGWSFYGPDAALLLSDAFLDTHCFRAVQGEGGVGLSFEPAPDRTVPDISGTLWFDGQGLLDRVEYRYTILDDELQRLRGAERTGGEVRFALLEGGAWIVRDWWIRMPRIRNEPEGFGGRVRTTMDGFAEVGGEVRRAEPLGGESQVFSVRLGALSGRITVGDSATGLPGAQVFLSGTAYDAVTSADGSFLLENIRPGRYDAVVDHPARRALGITAESWPVEIRANRVAALEVSLSGREDAVRRRCEAEGGVPRESWEEPNTGPATIVVGSVRADGRRVADWPVRVRWRRRSLGAGSGGAEVRERWSGVVLFTGNGGEWLACDLPLDVNVEVSLAEASATRTQVEAGDVRWGRWRPVGRPQAGEILWTEWDAGR